MSKSEQVLPVIGGSVAEFKHADYLPDLTLLKGNPILAQLSDMQCLFTQLASEITGVCAGVETMAAAMQIESRRAVAAVRAKRKRISQGQARVAVQIEQLLTRLESEGKLATAAVAAEALRGDREQLQALRDIQSDSGGFVEFFAILTALQKIHELQLDLAYAIAHLPTYPIQTECTAPEFLKQPEQILCGAVSIKAPPASPTDVTPLGYAVGCAA